MRDPRPNMPWSQKRLDERSDYEDWMESPEWFARRDRWYEEWCEFMGEPPFCQGCGKSWTLEHGDLHHLTYERLRHEEFSDLMSLCRKCHNRLHRTLEANPLWLRQGRASASIMIVARMSAEVQASAALEQLMVVEAEKMRAS